MVAKTGDSKACSADRRCFFLIAKSPQIRFYKSLEIPGGNSNYSFYLAILIIVFDFAIFFVINEYSTSPRPHKSTLFEYGPFLSISGD